jgi:hypothetical protein
MSEETKVVEPQNQTQEKPQEVNTEVQTPQQKTFSQEDLDRIIKQRLEAEKAKNQRAQEVAQAKEEEVKNAKTKADLENLMKQRIAEKDAEINKFKDEIKKERVDNSVLSVASKYNAINPQQVVDLIKPEIKLNDDNRIEVLDKNKNIRYDDKGELLTIEQRVKEFLDANPHFSQGSKSGVGSQSSIEGKTVKPFNISDLDLSKPEDRERYAKYRKERDSGAVQINLNK